MTAKEENKSPQIYGLMARVLGDVQSIAKTRRNEQQGYSFRGIDEVYEALHPVLAKHGVFAVPRVLEKQSFERETQKGGILRFVEVRMAYDFFAPDGSFVTAEALGEAMDSGDKASNKSMSAAHKYVLLQTFCIPTGDTPDADATTHDELKPAVPCPDCGGPTWDNRASKRNPRAPDYKCRNKGCNGAVWDDSEPAGQAVPDAGINALRGQIKKAMALLNEAGDVPEWTVQRVNEMSKQHFGAVAARLGFDALGQLAEMLSQRLEGIRKGGDSQERESILASIHASASEAEIASHLAANYNGRALEELTTAELDKIDKAIGIPF